MELYLYVIFNYYESTIFYRDVVEELSPIIKEAIDRKQENVRRRRRRDTLRNALIRIFRSMAQQAIFAHRWEHESSNVWLALF